jgi:hypothetical protein
MKNVTTHPHAGSISVVAAARNHVKTGKPEPRDRVIQLIGEKKAKQLFRSMRYNPSKKRTR